LGWGGSEAVALWAIEGLKDDYDVTLVTTGEVDLSSLNAYYGTQLSSENCTVVCAPLPPLLRSTERFAALRGGLFQRFCKRVAGQFDLMISAYGPMDFGVPGVQFISDFSFDDELRRELHKTGRGMLRILYSANPMRSLYLRLSSGVFSAQSDAWRTNLTVANSRWSSGIMASRYGVEAQIVYPPVLAEVPQVSFKDRENGFVCIGRLVPEKRIDLVVETLSEVRNRGHDIHLHILGGGSDDGYLRTLRQLQVKNQEWVFLEGWVAGENKAQLIARHRFGISGIANEAFGIAVAEMVKAGCLVFVANGGGQTEIVDAGELIYDDIDDAVGKITRVLSDERLQNRLLKRLEHQGESFSTQAFCHNIRKVVHGFFASREDRVTV
jgi:glycosyltransferase involved in cell wall biosynthesis